MSKIVKTLFRVILISLLHPSDQNLQILGHQKDEE